MRLYKLPTIIRLPLAFLWEIKEYNRVKKIYKKETSGLPEAPAFEYKYWRLYR